MEDTVAFFPYKVKIVDVFFIGIMKTNLLNTVVVLELPVWRRRDNQMAGLILHFLHGTRIRYKNLVLIHMVFIPYPICIFNIERGCSVAACFFAVHYSSGFGNTRVTPIRGKPYHQSQQPSLQNKGNTVHDSPPDIASGIHLEEALQIPLYSEAVVARWQHFQLAQELF